MKGEDISEYININIINKISGFRNKYWKHYKGAEQN
jgi:hypothetical protein